MANVKLEWLQATYVESFNIYRSDSSMNTASMPEPLATGITNTYYFDTNITIGETYYYRVGAVRENQELISSEVEILADAPVMNDPLWSSVELLIFADATSFPSTDFVDSSSKSRAIIASPAPQIVSPLVTEPIHDNGSIYFNGLNGQNLTIYTESAIGGSDFTIECFLKIPSVLSSSPLNAILFNVGGMSLDFNSNYSTLTIRYYSSPFSVSITRDKWTHVCMMRSGNNCHVYIHGVLVGSITTSDPFPQKRISMGEGSSGNRSLNAFINSVRLTKAVRYDISGFTPPESKFPNS